MNPIKSLICAMAAGAAALASNTGHAGVITNAVFVPLNLKMVVTYLDGMKVKSLAFTSKQILTLFGYPAGVTLAIKDNDVYAVSKTAVIDDLSAKGYFILRRGSVVSGTASNPNGYYKYVELGEGTLGYANAANLSAPATNKYYFSVVGQYTYTQSKSAITSAKTHTEADAFNCVSCSGSGYFPSLASTNAVLSGSMSGTASGKIKD